MDGPTPGQLPPLRSVPTHQVCAFPVRSPSATTYYTLKAKDAARLVSQSSSTHKRQAKWSKPQTTGALKHCWRFLRQELCDPRLALRTSAPLGGVRGNNASKRPSSDVNVLQNPECGGRWGSRRSLLKAADAVVSRGGFDGEAMQFPQLYYMKLKAQGMQCGLLEEVLGDDEEKSEVEKSCVSSENTRQTSQSQVDVCRTLHIVPASPFGRCSGELSSFTALAAALPPKSNENSPRLSCVDFLLEKKEEPLWNDTAVRGRESVAFSHVSSPVQPQPCIRRGSVAGAASTNEAQRLRLTLLMSTFQNMVDEMVVEHEHDEKEQEALQRHVSIFRELPLQSRYHEMHPLTNMQPMRVDIPSRHHHRQHHE
ncbi:hypothetical protein TRVL_04402 [Trypanosoma vivax]|nr:hypothetical protein TRVL_04402 [Trypanosoma vivax]